MKSKSTTNRTGPDWDGLYEVAAAQEGHFSTSQAASVGYSPQLLAKYLANGRIIRVMRGVYRLVHFPAGQHEEFVTIWLWSGQAAVFSHETALFLHCLSDAMPSKIHVTLPISWCHRRVKIPVDVMIKFREVSPNDQSWIGPVPVTTVMRTIADCANDHVLPDLISDAIAQAKDRGIIPRNFHLEKPI
jgi:predicted transcriptional regulator of viral defense system